MILQAVRISQDEVHILCNRCKFLYAASLTIDGFYDKGRVIKQGNEKHIHNLEEILRREVPKK